MGEPDTLPPTRILVIDDNRAIHDDMRKILEQPEAPQALALANDEAVLFSDRNRAQPERSRFELDSAYQGRQGWELLRQALHEGRPYALAFVDGRMPPGWDGIQTIARLWDEDPQLQTVVCTAYSDYSWNDVIAQLGETDRLLILKKPFDPIEVRQLACALTTKWRLTRQMSLRMTELEQLVAERTRRLQQNNGELRQLNIELAAARDQADAANRAKSCFLANMSHEIRTPLTAILGFGEALLERDLPEAQRFELIQIIHRNGRHLLSLIDDVLDLSKIEAGRLEITHEACNLPELLRDVYSLLGRRASDKGLQFAIEPAGPLPVTICTDPTRLRQILVNLVGNAIKFTARGSVCLRVSCKLPDAPDADRRLQFEVVDTGIGMTPEQIAAVFQPFVQADGQTTRKFGGTGLGLTISRRLAEMLAGNITVTSQLGRGSVFRGEVAAGSLKGVQFIDPDAWGCPEPVGAAVPQTPPAPGQFVCPCRILLAEDGPDNQRLITYFLTRAGARVEKADDGEVAVALALAAVADGQPFDVLLMDVQMPRLDGCSAARRLRARGYLRPIIALTAHVGTGDKQKCLASGCNDFLTKPIERGKLIQTVQLWLGHIQDEGVPQSRPVAAAPAVCVRDSR
jgi:signal transduction histidine kinase